SALASGWRGNGNGAIRLSRNGRIGWAANGATPVTTIANMATAPMVPPSGCHKLQNRPMQIPLNAGIFFLSFGSD
ncbi:MAG: hypothetical protein ACP5QA_16405, partial [Phycisphaerae bacterium]